jgi:hypothetical protein
MLKQDRLSHIIEVYLAGDLELDTAVAELVHVYIDRGWRFSLIETDCEPQFRERMRILAERADDAALSRLRSPRGRVFVDPPIIINS